MSQSIRDKVRGAYSSAAQQPRDHHPFPVGRSFAESLGYPAASLDEIPGASLDAFTGVSAVPSFADLPDRGKILDLGCGAGLDSLLIARRSTARAILGLDFSAAMLARARCAAAALSANNVLFCRADAERLPLNDASIDAAVVNGIFNLNPARAAIFSELARCIRPGGHLYAAELILKDPLPPGAADEANWFA